MIPFLRNSFRNQRPREPQGDGTENYCCCLPWQWLHLTWVHSDFPNPKSEISLLLFALAVITSAVSPFWFPNSFPSHSPAEFSRPLIGTNRKLDNGNILFRKPSNAVLVTLWLSLTPTAMIGVSHLSGIVNCVPEREVVIFFRPRRKFRVPITKIVWIRKIEM